MLVTRKTADLLFEWSRVPAEVAFVLPPFQLGRTEEALIRLYDLRTQEQIAVSQVGGGSRSKEMNNTAAR